MLKDQGLPLPAPWRNPPETDKDLAWYIEAFSDLSTCRHFGMGAGPIPWTAIVEYKEKEEIEDEEFGAFIRAMDSEYLKFVAEKNERENKK
jgi:hypothetical protein